MKQPSAWASRCGLVAYPIRSQPGSLSILSGVPGGMVTSTSTTSWTINLGPFFSQLSCGIGTAPACHDAPLSAITGRCMALPTRESLSTHSCAGQFIYRQLPKRTTGRSAPINGAAYDHYTFSDQWKYYALRRCNFLSTTRYVTLIGMADGCSSRPAPRRLRSDSAQPMRVELNYPGRSAYRLVELTNETGRRRT